MRSARHRSWVLRSLLLLAAGVALAVEAAPARSLLLVLDWQQGAPRLRQVQPLARPAFALRATARTPDDLFVRVSDATGRVLVEGWVDDPRRLRAPLPLPGEPLAGHASARREDVPLVLRLPLAARAGMLEIGGADGGTRWRLVVPDAR